MTRRIRKPFPTALILATGIVVLATAATAAPMTDSGAPTEVRLDARGHGWILTDTQGMTLYTYMKDPLAGPPACIAECADTWRPLLAPQDAAADGDWSAVARDDGSRQWTFRGKPLYTYSRDLSPADMNGDEFLQQWYVAVTPVPLPPGFSTLKTQHGYLLVEQRNMTLYTSSADSFGASACNGDCARTWQPVEAWWRAVSTLADWTTVNRADGTLQWAYKGQPLYRYRGDFAPGDMAGDGIATWQAILLELPPPAPDWVTYQKSDGGELLADPDGRTLYAHDLTKPRAFGIGIGRDMARPDLWIPVYAETESPPIGHWSVVVLEDGEYQWAYKGMKLYVNKRDTEPGALNGVRSSDRVWRTIMRSGQTMPGTGN